VVDPAIRRLLRRAGVKRIQHLVYTEARTELQKFLAGVIRDAIAICEYEGRRTVTAVDVVRALKKMGRGLFGYG
ncbi:histone-fold-containing protein, partial [Trichophaea hybrida]